MNPFKVMKPILVSLCMVLAVYAGMILPAYARQSEPQSVVQTQSLVNLNQASTEELMALKGIGPKMAERIIAYRQEKGPFKTVDQLVQVKGIGDAKFQKLKDQLTV